MQTDMEKVAFNLDLVVEKLDIFNIEFARYHKTLQVANLIALANHLDFPCSEQGDFSYLVGVLKLIKENVK